MAVTVWAQMTDWLSAGGWRPLAWSGGAVLVCLAVYLLLRKWLCSSAKDAGTARAHARLLGLGMLLVGVLVLIRIWTSAIQDVGTDRPAGRPQVLFEKLLWTFVAAGMAHLLVKAAQRALVRRSVDVGARHKIRMTTSWTGIALFLIAALFIWIGQIENLGVFLGIAGAGVALSLQETLVCIAGWLVLVVRRPFDIGDRIEIDGRVGDVIGISVFQTSMLEIGNWIGADQSTGRMLIIPNSMIIRHAIYNYTKGFPFVWDEFSVIVTFESDWQEAERLMLSNAEVEAEKIAGEVKRQIKKMQERYAIHYGKLSPIVYTSIADSGVRLTLRYLTPARRRRTVNHRISRNVLEAFIEHPRIDFAYMTARIFRNSEEGKSALGGPQRDGPDKA